MQNLHAFRKTSDEKKCPISLCFTWPHRPLGFAFGPRAVRDKCPNPLTLPCARHWRRAVFREKLWPWVKERWLSRADVKCCHRGTQLRAVSHQLPRAPVMSGSVLNEDLGGYHGTDYTLFACCSPYRYLPCPISHQTTDENYRTRHVCYANTCSLRERAVSNENHLWSSGLMSKLHSLASTNKKSLSQTTK